MQPKKPLKTDLVAVSIPYGERELEKKAREIGGKWDPDVKLWYIPVDKVKGTQLERHIILDAKAKRKIDKSI